jgi:hypothetical protein
MNQLTYLGLANVQHWYIPLLNTLLEEKLATSIRIAQSDTILSRTGL